MLQALREATSKEDYYQRIRKKLAADSPAVDVKKANGSSSSGQASSSTSSPSTSAVTRSRLGIGTLDYRYHGEWVPFRSQDVAAVSQQYSHGQDFAHLEISSNRSYIYLSDLWSCGAMSLPTVTL